MIRVSIRYIDGGLHEYSISGDFLLRFTELQDQGHRGKDLIETLLVTDDWGSTPLSVQIKGTGPDGARVEIQIPYE